ncbi:MAG: hypothetical protein JO047_10540 [Alphaproteobacteria bacterium]|nr:hypothetical protein [Alphaproteobacteria bacterium]
MPLRLTLCQLLAVACLVAQLSPALAAETLYGPGVPRVNPLLGNWRIQHEELNPATPGAHCIPELTFAPDSTTWVADGQEHSAPVSFYNVGKDAVSILGNTGRPVTYELKGEGLIAHRDGMATCLYRKS